MKPLRWLAVAGLVSATILTFENRLRADDSDTIGALRAQIEELDQKVRILERKGEISQEETTKKLKSIPTIKADSKGLTVQSQDKAFKFRLSGLIQADYRAFLDEEGVSPGGTDKNDGFLLRRVRPRFRGTLWERLDFDFQPELSWSNNSSGAGTNSVRVVDASGDFHILDDKALSVKFGLFKTPLGIERLQSAANLLFVERGLTTNLVPSRDLGVQVHGFLWDEQFRYALGVFNGSADSDDQRTNSDTDDSLDVDLGIFLEPFKKNGPEFLKGLGFGVAGTLGDHGGTFQNSGRTRYRSAGQDTFFDTNTTAYNYDGEFYRVNPQVYYYNGPFGLLAEYVYNTFDFQRATGAGAGATGTFESQAWTAQISYVLTGDDASYKGVKPLHPVNFKDGGLGAWEIAARIGGVSVGDEAFQTIGGGTLATGGSASDALAWGFALNWYLNDNLRAGVNFEQTAYNGVNGAGGDKPTENAVLARLQVAF